MDKVDIEQEQPPDAGEPAAPSTEKRRERPTRYDQVIAEAYCERLSSRQEPVSEIHLDRSLPSAKTVTKWARKEPAFAEMLRVAREQRALSRIDAIEDAIEQVKAKMMMPDVARLIADTELKLARVENPRRFAAADGQKIAIEHSGPGGKAIILDVNSDEALIGAARNVAFKLLTGNVALATALSKAGVLSSPTIDAEPADSSQASEKDEGTQS